MEKLVLFGCGRGADVAYRLLTRLEKYDICAFTVDEKYIKQHDFHGLPVVPFESVEDIYPPGSYLMFILLGFQEMNSLREQKYKDAKAKGYQFINYIANNVVISEDVEIGENCFILDNQSINLDVKIGNNVVMWSSNHIGDCSVIEDHAWLSSHVTISGNVTIQTGAFLGIGCSISNNVVVAPRSYIGAGTLITSNTKQAGVYAVSGTPCVADNSHMFMKVMSASLKM